MLTGLDAIPGQEHYRERLGGDHNASLLHADNKAYIPNRSGVTAVIAPGKTFNLLAKNELPGKIMACQVVADCAFFLRTDAALYRLEEKGGGEVRTRESCGRAPVMPSPTSRLHSSRSAQAIEPVRVRL